MTARVPFRWLWLFLAACLGAAAARAADEFTVLHFSDVHIGPYLARDGAPGAVRGADTIAWMARAVAGPQAVGEKRTEPAPEFAIVTGDITEYGVIDDTWEIAQRALDVLPFPWYAVAGNHDNTWVALYDVMRRRHGGANYAFDHGGWHFVVLCSASPQEPVPSLDATTRAWLTADLAKVRRGTPIVLALHHPPEIGEFANPAEMDTFVDLIRDFDVQLMLVGHGHSPRKHDILGIPAIEGGSTFGPNAGYGLLDLSAQRVRYDYRRYPQSEKAEGKEDAWKRLHAAPVVQRQRRIAWVEPAEGLRVGDGELPVRLEPVGADAAKVAELTLAIDGVERVKLNDVALADAAQKLATAELVEGAHLLTAKVRLAGEDKPGVDLQDCRTRIFHIDRGKTEVRWRAALPAAVKAGPVVMGDLLVVAGTDGVVRGLARTSGAPRWTFATGGEILATPALADDTLVFGSGDGSVYALDAAGKERWRQPVGKPVYGQPLIADGVVYLGDNGGNLHALTLADGKPRWTFRRADFAIEAAPALWGDALCFGAWDGYLYCLDRADGTLRWRQLGPKSSIHKAFRYYAPADCGPVAAGERLFVCDRGYHLGVFAPDGTLGRNEPLNVSALSAGPDGLLYARHLDDSVRKLDPSGETLWQAKAPTGRFPVPPTVAGERVYLCSNTGRVSALSARDGATIWTYQATAGFYVMAPVAVAADGTCFVAGMDGTVTAIRERNR